MKLKYLVPVMVLILLLVVVGTVAAGQTVTLSDPDFTEVDIWFDLNSNGAKNTGENQGTFPSYDWDNDLTASWVADPAATSYRVSIWCKVMNDEQYLQMWVDGTLPSIDSYAWIIENKVSHHWAENPEGTTFVFGAIGWGENTPLYWPCRIRVEPETTLYDATIGGYSYTGTGGEVQWSEWFYLLP